MDFDATGVRRGGMRTISFLASLGLAGWLSVTVPTSRAQADAIPELPPCPAGSTRVIEGHQVIYCQPTTCGGDDTCGGGVCRSAGLCVAVGTRSVSSSFPPMPGDEMTEVSFREARATCSDAQTCASGTCEVARRCLASVPDTSPTSSAGPRGGCAVHPGGTRLGPAGIGLALLGLFVRRRS